MSRDVSRKKKWLSSALVQNGLSLPLLHFLGLWYNIQKSIAGGMSGVFKHILRFFFNANAGAHNFKTGILVESPARPHDSWLLQAEFGAFVGDEKACKEVSDTKGASGTSFCLFCKNVVRNVGSLNTTDYCQSDCFLYLRNFKLRSQWCRYPIKPAEAG